MGLEGIAPLELLSRGRAEIEECGGTVQHGQVVAVEKVDTSTLRVVLDDQSAAVARKVLVATGVIDQLPDIPGLAERWGRDVLHCAYCHAYEVRDKKIGLIANGTGSLHQVQLWRQWSNHVVLLTNDTLELTARDQEELAARDIAVAHGKVTGVEIVDDALRGLRVGEHIIEADVAVVFPVSVANVDPFTGLGLRVDEKFMGEQLVGATVTASDDFGGTGIDNVWVAGNIAGHRGQIIAAAAEGSQVAAMINIDLVNDDVRDAVERRRPFSAEMERRNAEHLQRDKW